jgi:RNA polymerase sigma-70 factor (ECF subfamily)
MTVPNTKYTSMDDASLARQARADPEAFAELYHRHVRSVYRYHLAHTGNVRDAEDLTSQTFMAALEGIRSYRGTGPYLTWLIGIASRKRALFFRAHKPEILLDAAHGIPTPNLATDKAAVRRNFGPTGAALFFMAPLPHPQACSKCSWSIQILPRLPPL